MEIEQQIDDKSDTQTPGRIELGCALVMTALYWPFMSCAMVTFHVLLGVPKQPFDSAMGMVPSMLIMSSSFQSVVQSLTPDERNNWRTVARKCLRLLPFVLIMGTINILAESVLQFGWSTANRYAFILFGSFTLGAVCTACTYVLWRLLVQPILNPRQPSPSE